MTCAMAVLVRFLGGAGHCSKKYIFVDMWQKFVLN